MVPVSALPELEPAIAETVSEVTPISETGLPHWGQLTTVVPSGGVTLSEARQAGQTTA